MSLQAAHLRTLQVTKLGLNIHSNEVIKSLELMTFFYSVLVIQLDVPV